MQPDIQPILDLAQQALNAKQLGVLGVLGVLLAGAVQIWKLPLVQNLLGSIPKVGKYLAWDQLGSVGRLLIVFVLSAAGALLSALATGTGWSAAIIGALVVGMSAIGTHQTLKAVRPAKEAHSLRVPYDPKQDPTQRGEVSALALGALMVALLLVTVGIAIFVNDLW